MNTTSTNGTHTRTFTPTQGFVRVKYSASAAFSLANATLNMVDVDTVYTVLARGGYRYAFQGQERDDEISGKGNSYTAEFWQYSSRLGRRWNIDPIVKPHESPYAAFANNPIWFKDPSGADTVNYRSSIDNSKFNGAIDVASGSNSFTDFLNKFISSSGVYNDVTLEFKSVKDLKSAESGNDVLGQVRLMFKDSKGNWTWVEEMKSLPQNTMLSDFKILVELKSNATSGSAGQPGAGDELKALKTVTLIHELLLHGSTSVEILNSNRIKDANGKTTGVNGETILTQYKERLATDHENLYARKAKLYMASYNELIDFWRIKNTPTQKLAHPDIIYPSRVGWESSQRQKNPTLKFYEILWQEFENDVAPVTIGK